MDIFDWIQYNPNIVQENTTKKFFGLYLYRLVVLCPGGRAIDSKQDIAKEVQHRRSISAKIGGWWGQRMVRDLDQADVEFLGRMRILRHQKPNGIKMRVEEPRLQLYAESEEQLQNIVQVYFDQSDYRYIESIAGPESVETAVALNSGAIIRRRNLGYTHKVIIRDGKYSTEIKTSILNYLTGVDQTTVKIPRAFLQMLTKSSSYMWNGYFYTNDPDVATFINLIHPSLVLNIHELIVTDTK
jgi:hypothetical protein